MCVKDDMEGSGVGVANGVPGARGPEGHQVGVLCSWLSFFDPMYEFGHFHTFSY